MPSDSSINCHIPHDFAGRRLDQALATLLTDYSRSRLQQGIRSGHIRLDGRTVRPRDRVVGGELVSGILPYEEETFAKPQEIPLDILYQDADILIIDKPAGLVVHPAAGNRDGTLVNALLHQVPELAVLPRAGLVHRLDKDTTGLLVVACSPRAHASLVAQLQSRALGREYEALVSGIATAGGTVDAPIGRHPVDRKRMAVTTGGKPAVTHYRVWRRFWAHSHLRIKLETGRTHQIRVHMAHIRHPLVGDPVYGSRLRRLAGASRQCEEVLHNFRRQALHAVYLSLTHPGNGERLEWRSPLPVDMVELLAVLKRDAELSSD